MRSSTAPLSQRVHQGPPTRAPSSLAVRATSSRPNGAHDSVGIIIVDHGSRRKESNEMLEEFARLYQSSTGRSIVEPAHMEIAEPSIAAAFDRCVARGAQKVVIAPYFLSRGKHIQSDIPALVQEAAAKHPGIGFVIADPIGIDSLMAQLIDNRVAVAEGKLTAVPAQGTDPAAAQPGPGPPAGPDVAASAPAAGSAATGGGCTIM